MQILGLFGFGGFKHLQVLYFCRKTTYESLKFQTEPLDQRDPLRESEAGALIPGLPVV